MDNMNCVLIDLGNVVYLNMNLVKDPKCNDCQVPHTSRVLVAIVVAFPKRAFSTPGTYHNLEITIQMKLSYPLLGQYIRSGIFDQCSKKNALVM